MKDAQSLGKGNNTGKDGITHSSDNKHSPTSGQPGAEEGEVPTHANGNSRAFMYFLKLLKCKYVFASSTRTLKFINNEDVARKTHQVSRGY